jgi:hypothetical protein
METVTIRLQDQYVMPEVCCACGAPAGTGKLTTSGFSRGSGRFLNLTFPLCDRCARLSEMVNRRRRTSRWVALGVSLFLCVALGLPQTLEAVPGTSVYTFLESLIVLAPLALVGMLAAQSFASVVGLEREVRDTFRRVSRAVGIEHYDTDPLGDGYVTLAFGNEQFADLFQKINVGVVLPGGLRRAL